MSKTCHHCHIEKTGAEYRPGHGICDACLTLYPQLKTHACGVCAKPRAVSKFPGGVPGPACSYCSAEYDSEAPEYLSRATLTGSGHTTTEALLAALGFAHPTRADVMAANRWLKLAGFDRSVIRGSRGWRVSVPSTLNSFSAWAAAHPEYVAALGMPKAMRATLEAGAPVPPYVRYAMMAVTAGLPPF